MLVVVGWVRGSIVVRDDDMDKVQRAQRETCECKNKDTFINHILLAIGQNFQAIEEFQAGLF